MDFLKDKKKLGLLFAILFVSWIVSFYISTRLLMRENQEIVVPKIVGFPLTEAQRMLEQRTLILKIDQAQETTEFPENTVISQSVEPGTIVKEGRTIAIRISKQIDMMEIPNVSGKDLSEAKRMIEKMNLKIVNIAYGCNPRVPAQKIISQSPQSDELVTNRNIQLLVSTGSCQNQFVIRDLLESKIDSKIKKEFSDRNINLRIVSSTQTRGNMANGRVVRQEPASGSVVKSGDNVVLTVE